MKVLEFIKNHWKDLLLVTFAVACIALIMSTTCVSQKNHELDTNLKAMTDSVHTMEMKNGDLLYEKQGMILEKKELEKYLDITKKEVNELERTLKSKIAYINKLEGTVRVDTLVMHDSIIYREDSILINFDYSDKYLAMDGTTIVIDSVPSTTLNNITIDAPLTVGVTEDNQIFVRTGNPYLNFSSIEGAQLKTQKSKPKNWNLGVQLGIGGQYDLIHKTFGVGPYLGVGISYGWDF